MGWKSTDFLLSAYNFCIYHSSSAIRKGKEGCPSPSAKSLRNFNPDCKRLNIFCIWPVSKGGDLSQKWLGDFTLQLAFKNSNLSNFLFSFVKSPNDAKMAIFLKKNHKNRPGTESFTPKPLSVILYAWITLVCYASCLNETFFKQKILSLGPRPPP